MSITEYSKIPYLTEAYMDPDFEAPRKNERLEGKYANYFEVGYNAYEFIIDFGQYYSENEGAELCTRIITSPAYAKELLETLLKSLRNFEQAYGEIENNK